MCVWWWGGGEGGEGGVGGRGEGDFTPTKGRFSSCTNKCSFVSFSDLTSSEILSTAVVRQIFGSAVWKIQRRVIYI